MAVAETSLPKVNLAARNGRKLGRTFIYHLIVAAFGFVMIYPILWLFASSLKSADEIWTNASSLIPQEVTFRNYLVGWAGFGGVTFTTFFYQLFHLRRSGNGGRSFLFSGGGLWLRPDSICRPELLVFLHDDNLDAPGPGPDYSSIYRF